MNDSGTSNDIGAETVPDIRTPDDLRSFLHGYRIRNGGRLQRTARASIVIEGIDLGRITPATLRAAREMADLDPSLHWLPDWKPRVAVKGGTIDE